MDASALKAVILCGGEGLRFKNEHLVGSKVLAEINNKPLILHIMLHYNKFGVTHFILCVRNDDQSIADYFNNHLYPSDWIIEIVPTGNDTPTGGRILFLNERINDIRFFVTYGDGLSDVNIQKLLDAHVEMKTIATLTAVRPFSQYGILNISDENIIESFEEKPQMRDWVNGGFFVFERAIFSHLSLNTSLEESLMKHLVPMGQLSAFRHNGFWKSMDTYKDFKELDAMMSVRALNNAQ